MEIFLFLLSALLALSISVFQVQAKDNDPPAVTFFYDDHCKENAGTFWLEPLPDKTANVVYGGPYGSRSAWFEYLGTDMAWWTIESGEPFHPLVSAQFPLLKQCVAFPNDIYATVSFIQ